MAARRDIGASSLGSQDYNLRRGRPKVRWDGDCWCGYDRLLLVRVLGYAARCWYAGAAAAGGLLLAPNRGRRGVDAVALHPLGALPRPAIRVDLRGHLISITCKSSPLAMTRSSPMNPSCSSERSGRSIRADPSAKRCSTRTVQIIKHLTHTHDARSCGGGGIAHLRFTGGCSRRCSSQADGEHDHEHTGRQRQRLGVEGQIEDAHLARERALCSLMG